MKQIIKTTLGIVATGAAMVLFVAMTAKGFAEWDVRCAIQLGEDGIVREYYKFMGNGTLEKGTKSYESYKKSVEAAFGESFFKELEEGYESAEDEVEMYEFGFRSPEYCLSLGGTE